MAPPRKVFADGNETIKKHNLIPAATLILEGDVEISSEMLQKYIKNN